VIIFLRLPALGPPHEPPVFMALLVAAYTRKCKHLHALCDLASEMTSEMMTAPAPRVDAKNLYALPASQSFCAFMIQTAL